MDAVRNEFERLRKDHEAAGPIKEVDNIISFLQQTRDQIIQDPSSASVILAKAQNPANSGFSRVNSKLKETHSALNKYGKSIDKLFKDKPLPSTEYDALSEQPGLVNRAIAMHLLREGQFGVAETFLSEMAGKENSASQTAYTGTNTIGDSRMELDQLQAGEIRVQFSLMYRILAELKDNHNVLPAIEWATMHRSLLHARGSNLEFELSRLQFLWLFHGGNDPENTPLSTARQNALKYAREHFSTFQTRHLTEIQQLVGAMAFCSNLTESPYRNIFNNPTSWTDVASSFTREFCSLLGLSPDSPLYVAVTAGAIALPTLLKLQTIMKQKHTEWTTENELPVEIPLPPSYHFHSIFVCPVSKEQATENNPPMMLPCGHVIANDSLIKISKGGRLKCPYCPSESSTSHARRIYM